jgi:divalent metal cation (Fe/Co/Zn/Cd) transporter
MHTRAHLAIVIWHGGIIMVSVVNSVSLEAVAEKEAEAVEKEVEVCEVVSVMANKVVTTREEAEEGAFIEITLMQMVRMA